MKKTYRRIRSQKFAGNYIKISIRSQDHIKHRCELETESSK